MRKKCFAPVVDEHTRLLVLGSLPGEKSLLQAEYYANRQNSFWYLMSVVVDADLVKMAYQEKLNCLLRHGIGLWDVVAEAKREGSLDNNIKSREDNDLLTLVRSLPQLRGIAFNGAIAFKLGLRIIGSDAEKFDVFALPSSSPAYTLAVSKKVEHWTKLRETLNNRE